jgi:tetratricopeptide (TPR) repeat protein
MSARRVLVAAWFLVLSTLTLTAPVSAASLSEARARLAAGDRAGARVMLDALLAPGTSLPEADRREAEFLRAGLEESGESYEDRLRALLDHGLDRERQGSAHLALGQIAYVRGDFAVAVREFEKAREDGRGDEGSLWEGLAATALGDIEVAQAALGRAEHSKNRSIHDRALFVVGSSYRAGENWASARDAFRKIRDEGPESDWWSAAAIAEAECLEQQNDGSGAATLYNELLTQRPDAYEAPLALDRLGFVTLPATAVPAQNVGPRPVTYSVQLGAFADPANAQSFARALEQRHIAPVRVVHTENGLHRVLVGTGLVRARAEALGDSLGTALGVGFSLSPEKGEP